MFIKARVWEPGNADPSPTRGFEASQEFIDFVHGLNPGDSVSFIMPGTLRGGYTISSHLTMRSDKPGLYEILWTMINATVAPWLTEEQQDIVTAKAIEIVKQEEDGYDASSETIRGCVEEPAPS